MKDGTHYFYIIGPDGKLASVWLELAGRGRIRHAAFYIQGNHWNIGPEAKEQLFDLYWNYWSDNWTQRPTKIWSGSGSKSAVSIDFLRDDSGMWLYRAAQFFSDPHNLVPLFFEAASEQKAF